MWWVRRSCEEQLEMRIEVAVGANLCQLTATFGESLERYRLLFLRERKICLCT